MSTTGYDVFRVGLAAVNRLASMPVLDRWKLRRPTEKALYTATRTGVRTAAAASRVFAGGRRPASAIA